MSKGLLDALDKIEERQNKPAKKPDKKPPTQVSGALNPADQSNQSEKSNGE